MKGERDQREREGFGEAVLCGFAGVAGVVVSARTKRVRPERTSEANGERSEP